MIGLFLIAGLILTSAIYAQNPRGGHGMGSSTPAGGYGTGDSTTVDIEVVKKFQKETLPLRDELITKKLELHKEYSKTNPDKGRIATLRKEMVDIELKIQEKADTAGLSPWGCGMMGHGMMGHGMMGKGMMGRGMMGMECPCQM